jgi:hypothetical protein
VAINYSTSRHHPIRVCPKAARWRKQTTCTDALRTQHGGAVGGGEFGHKKVRLWSDAAREVVGPGYMSGPVAAIHQLGVARLAKDEQKGDRRGEKDDMLLALPEGKQGQTSDECSS